MIIRDRAVGARRCVTLVDCVLRVISALGVDVGFGAASIGTVCSMCCGLIDEAVGVNRMLGRSGAEEVRFSTMV